jgi:hypothetical protein
MLIEHLLRRLGIHPLFFKSLLLLDSFTFLFLPFFNQVKPVLVEVDDLVVVLDQSILALNSVDPLDNLMDATG